MADENPTYDQEEINEFIKAFRKRLKQDQTTTLLEGRDVKKRDSILQSLIELVEETRHKSSKDGGAATKRLPSSHRSNLKNFKKPSRRSSEYSQRRKESPSTSQKRRTHSSSSHDSTRFHYPKHSDLPKKSSGQQNTERYGNNKSCKSQALERSSSLEREDDCQISKSKSRAQRSSSNRCNRRSCSCRSSDSLSSSEDESYYHYPEHQSPRSRHSSRLLHRRRSPRSPCPDLKNSTKHRDESHKSKRSTSSRPMDMANEPHSSKSQPPVQSDSFNDYERRSQSSRSYDLKRESCSAQSYVGHHKGHKRCRSPSFERWSWSRSPAKDDVKERSFEEDLEREILRQKTCSAKKRKFSGKEILRTPSLERGSWNRYSGKKDAPRETFQDKARKDKLNKVNCPVDKECNKRMNEEIIKAMKMKENIKKWITSNDEGNSSSTRNPRVLSRSSSAAFENDPVCHAKSQEVDPSQESKVLMAKDKIRQTEYQKFSSKESKSSVEKDPIMVTSSKRDQCGECEVPKLIFVEKRVSDEKYQCRDFEASDVTFIGREVSNKAQCEASAAQEVSFIEERRVTIDTNQCGESGASDVTLVEVEVSNEGQCEVSEVPEVTFVEERRIANEKNPCGESEGQDVTSIQMKVSNKDRCEESEASEVSFIEETRGTNKNVQCGESEAHEVIFVESGARNQKDQCLVSKAPKLTFVEKKRFTNEELHRKSEAKEVTLRKRDPFSNTVSLPEDHTAIQNDFQEQKKIMPSTFFCSLCQIHLTSEVTWSTHIVGKKHARKMQIQTVYEIAKASLPVLATPSIVSDDAPRFAHPPFGKRRILTREIARLQSAIDEIREPVPGLEYVHEIISFMGVNYYCTLCEVPCNPGSIIYHLIGFKHQLCAARELFPGHYNINSIQRAQFLKREIRDMLYKYEIEHGRGSIQVFREVDDHDTRSVFDRLGPSYRCPTSPYIEREQWNQGLTNLYIANLPPSMTEMELEDMLQPYGNVMSTNIFRDRGMNSIGIAFARMSEHYMCEKIIRRFNGTVLPGAKNALLVKYANGGSYSRNPYKTDHRLWTHRAEQQKQGPTNLYIAHLPISMTEKELEDMLLPFGNVISTNLFTDPGMKSLGFGFARMEKNYICERIIQRLNGKVLPGAKKALLVKFAEKQFENKKQSYIKVPYIKKENVKKLPSESITKKRSEKLSGVFSKLEQLIEEEANDELIVGLDYIRETRGPSGEMYNCFLCNSGSTNNDIIEHLLLPKHRTKYLEKLNLEGKSKVIEEINNLKLRESSRDSLITYHCYKMVEDFGRGKVEVYKSKDMTN